MSKEVTIEVDENGNILGLGKCEKAFFAFMEDENVYNKISWPKGSYKILIEKSGQITFKTDSRLRIHCGCFVVAPTLTCQPGFTKVWIGTEWVCVPAR